MSPPLTHLKCHQPANIEEKNRTGSVVQDMTNASNYCHHLNELYSQSKIFYQFHGSWRLFLLASFPGSKISWLPVCKHGGERPHYTRQTEGRYTRGVVWTLQFTNLFISPNCTKRIALMYCVNVPTFSSWTRHYKQEPQDCLSSTTSHVSTITSYHHM